MFCMHSPFSSYMGPGLNVMHLRNTSRDYLMATGFLPPTKKFLLARPSSSVFLILNPLNS